MTTHMISTLAMRSFHQMRSAGGTTAIMFPLLLRDWNLDDFHDAPDEIKHGWNRDAQEQ